MKILNYDLSDKLKNVGYYQLLGGVAGLCRFLWSLIYVGQITGLLMLLSLLVIAFFFANIYLGNRLRKGDDSVLGLSKINQIFQIVYFTVSPFGYAMSAGLSLYVGFDYIDQFQADIQLFISNFYLHYNPSEFYFQFYINLVPFFVIYYIERIQDGIENRKALLDYSNETNQLSS